MAAGIAVLWALLDLCHASCQLVELMLDGWQPTNLRKTAMRSAIIRRAAVRKWALPIRRVHDGEVEQPAGSLGGVAFCCSPDSVEVVIKGREERMPEKVVDKLVPGVEYAAGFAPAGLRLVEELRFSELSFFAGSGRPEYISLRIVSRSSGHSQRIVSRTS